MIPFAVAAAALLAWLIFRRRPRPRPARTLIISPPRSTVIAGDGSVCSVQSARIQMAPAELERLWIPANLENLGRTYWLFLTRATLGLVRVKYTAEERAATILGTPITLLRFTRPHYKISRDRATATWRIKNGLLVAKSGVGRGHLSLTVIRNSDTEIEVEVEVANFYPAIAVWFSTLVYEATQSFIHVLVTHGFLRSLATLQLRESSVGALREQLAQAAADSPFVSDAAVEDALGAPGTSGSPGD
jgi:hypothetical protein